MFQLELMTRIELVNLILTKDALYRLSYISICNENYYSRSDAILQAFFANFFKFLFSAYTHV